MQYVLRARSDRITSGRNFTRTVRGSSLGLAGGAARGLLRAIGLAGGAARGGCAPACALATRRLEESPTINRWGNRINVCLQLLAAEHGRSLIQSSQGKLSAVASGGYPSVFREKFCPPAHPIFFGMKWKRSAGLPTTRGGPWTFVLKVSQDLDWGTHW